MQLTVDSEVVVRLLVEPTPTNSPYIHIIRKCKSLISRQDWEVTIGYCYREANRAADWLANFGVQLEQKWVSFGAAPKDLRAVLLEDLSGVAWSRMVPESTD